MTINSNTAEMDAVLTAAKAIVAAARTAPKACDINNTRKNRKLS